MTQASSQPPGEQREDLEEGIERARQDLADTVEALAAKADVPMRVRDKAAQVRERVTGTFTTLTAAAREKAPTVREQVGQAIPEPARRTTRRAARAVGERPAVLYAVAGAFTAAGLWVWRLRRRS